MAGTAPSDNSANDRIMLGLLESVERDGGQSQRRLASELGIALGLVNAYLKRCVNKGLIKVRQVPARRYAYYLTPNGFAEKSRLTVEYLSSSLSLFRRAKADCLALFEAMHAQGVERIALLGISDLAEIAVICGHDSGISIVAMVDARSDRRRFVGLPVVKSFEQLGGGVEAAVVTDVRLARAVIEQAVAHFGADRVQAPALLGLRIGREIEVTR